MDGGRRAVSDGEIKFSPYIIPKVNNLQSGCCFVIREELMFLCLFIASFVPLTQISAKWGWEMGWGSRELSSCDFFVSVLQIALGSTREFLETLRVHETMWPNIWKPRPPSRTS